MIDFSILSQDEPLQIIIGAGEQRYDGWIATQQEDLDLLDPQSWESKFNGRFADAFLCEHVWEHLRACCKSRGFPSEKPFEDL